MDSETNNEGAAEMKHATHNNTVHTDDTQPGYVMFDAAAWNLPDNTDGKVGLHVTYRPLAGSMYKGNEMVTAAMKQAVREHYDSREMAEEAIRKAEREAVMAKLRAKREASTMQVCPKCETVCYGDCQA